MNNNPAYRYAAVPVELPQGDAVYVVRMQSKEQAIKAVANAVDPESLINLNETRTFDTKKQAEKHAGSTSTVYLDSTKPLPPPVEESLPEQAKAANPTRKLKSKLLR